MDISITTHRDERVCCASAGDHCHMSGGNRHAKTQSIFHRIAWWEVHGNQRTTVGTSRRPPYATSNSRTDAGHSAVCGMCDVSVQSARFWPRQRRQTKDRWQGVYC